LAAFPNRRANPKSITKTLKIYKNDRFAVKLVADIFIKRNKLDKALQLLEAEKGFGGSLSFQHEIAGLLKMTGNEDKMINELLNFVKRSPDEIENVKNTFQII
jgi:hypothetical protein